MMPDDLWPLEADKELLEHAISNILKNSIEAMSSGGLIKITAQNIDSAEKEVPQLKEGRYIKISITDQGSGIPEKDLTKIFDPYFTTKELTSTKGIGLGLTIAHSIIKDHDGAIAVKSEEGKGTTFHIYLPSHA